MCYTKNSFNLYILPPTVFQGKNTYRLKIQFFSDKKKYRWNLHDINPTLKSTTYKLVKFTIAHYII